MINLGNYEVGTMPHRFYVTNCYEESAGVSRPVREVVQSITWQLKAQSVTMKEDKKVAYAERFKELAAFGMREAGMLLWLSG